MNQYQERGSVMKVFVVISGYGDDCSPVNIFKTRILANEWIEKNKKKLYQPCVEEWEVFGKIENIEPCQGNKEMH